MAGTIVVSDMDGTLTGAEAWRGIYRWVRANHPSPAARRFVAMRIPEVVLVRAGLIDKEAFRVRWLRDMAQLLRGLDAQQLEAMATWTVEQHLWPARRRGALEVLADAAAEARTAYGEVEVIVATASYQPVADAFARRAGADLALATPLEMVDGLATGRLAAPVQSQAEKAGGVAARAGERPVLVAMGDSGGDIPLLALARRGIAVSPDAALRRAAAERGWEILDGR